METVGTASSIVIVRYGTQTLTLIEKDLDWI